MRAFIVTAVAALAASAAAPAAAQYYGNNNYGYGGDIVRCESNDGRTRECPTNGGRAMIERQLSRSACIEGRTWGSRRGGIWVSDGCRADFRVTGYGGGYNDGYYGNQGNGHGNGYGSTVRCESNDGRTNRCAINGRGRAQLTRQLSRSACIEGRTWGSDSGSVWVSQGCRAEFTVNRGNYGGNWGNSGYGYGGQIFRCESNDGRTRECAANTRSGVQLVRQLSKSACIQGRTWGYGRNGIWVSDGCRAEFRTY
ncbi:DUF3011 domain-containing protein [Thermomonas sp. HDW16]|uniref:DUF3011 domain-containing protein n=1 Tax=Thermomonas sp. HDW16 TaxID=2714945 RepID=UPI00140CB944|nr:DUF3011 domain-containing protein [Thermomonas sp. HDW16]QIL20730.1 DUF3011 domain-containing protein [Thermomonas sp. HDW16]